ncbi:ABC transporter substrate-binding protein [Devosia sp. XJ19-1]|uniref:ABC transporter substrate-binding protein n=1 Tax=Devosia ureilytica TaxID=2952754 RepID=A0A9Q4FS57_9HYPH|nr:ABC transporter substrate-binding protein [Devosia ureilytica]MCP8882675.1 ABC transporter substrate-binding protein [Devosia ureilytica]MCP8886957.1 ABC transporter substrate-binding protein [Devosia ureilytica]
MILKSGGIAAAIAVAFLSASSLPALAQDADAAACGTDRTIDIAEMSWPSAAALAHIHATILEQGYGCDVEIVAGDTVPTSSSMLTRGNPAVAPELWTSAIEEAWDAAIEEGTVVELSDAITDGTVEGWFIPAYVQEEYPELTTAEAVIARPDLFADPEDPSKGRLYSCPPGWACELSTSALFEAFGMEETWNLFSPGSGGALDASIARAFTREEPILFYYWGPTAILGKFPAVQLDIGEADVAVYQCNTDPDCDEPAGVTAYPSSPAVVGAAAWITEDAPAVADYFSKVGLTNAEISELLVYGDENQADAEATAENFLKTKQDVWTNWVPAEVAEKVLATLG